MQQSYQQINLKTIIKVYSHLYWYLKKDFSVCPQPCRGILLFSKILVRVKSERLPLLQPLCIITMPNEYQFEVNMPLRNDNMPSIPATIAVTASTVMSTANPSVEL
jgi:hypothetical protein